jgi:AcrR family transcriptional regulator
MRNAEASRERILGAALVEFAAYGIAGARVDRIAKAAECNKNLIYIYFESKETLFATVLRKNLARVYEDNPFTPNDLPGYAARVFDFAMAQPELMRLMAWYGLEQTVEAPSERGESARKRISALTEAQRKGKVGGAFPPGFLVVAIMSLATAWSASNPFGPSLDPDAAKNPVALRATIAEAVRRLAAAP